MWGAHSLGVTKADLEASYSADRIASKKGLRKILTVLGDPCFASGCHAGLGERTRYTLYFMTPAHKWPTKPLTYDEAIQAKIRGEKMNTYEGIGVTFKGTLYVITGKEIVVDVGDVPTKELPQVKEILGEMASTVMKAAAERDLDALDLEKRARRELRRDPRGPLVSELVKPGDTVKTNYRTGGRVTKVFARRMGKVAVWTIVYQAVGNVGKATNWLNDLVGVDGRILKRDADSNDEVFVTKNQPRLPPATAPVVGSGRRVLKSKSKPRRSNGKEKPTKKGGAKKPRPSAR